MNVLPRNQTVPKLIPVGTNDWALVDEEDYDRLSRHFWMNSNGYARRHLKPYEWKRWGKSKKSSVSMHREILGSTDPEIDTDHVNHNGLDNRRCNLRVVTTCQNMQRARKRLLAKPDRITTSRFKGVSFRSDRKRWTAYINCDGKRVTLGCYATEEQAAMAYNEAAAKLHGEFANLNET